MGEEYLGQVGCVPEIRGSSECLRDPKKRPLWVGHRIEAIPMMSVQKQSKGSQAVL